MEGTAEVRAAVALALARAAGLSSGRVVTALTPHAQLFVAALLILRTRLGEEKNATMCVLGIELRALKRSLRRDSCRPTERHAVLLRGPRL